MRRASGVKHECKRSRGRPRGDRWRLRSIDPERDDRSLDWRGADGLEGSCQGHQVLSKQNQ